MTSEQAGTIAVGVLAFLAVVALVPLVRRLAIAYGVTDKPSQGKLHSTATPYLGGIAVALAIAGTSAFLPGWSEEGAAILVGALLVGVVGLVDDMGTIGPGSRVAVEAVAASVAFAGGARVEVAGGIVDFVLTVGVLVLLTNSFNLLDNMDGAAGVIGTTTALALVAAAVLHEQVLVAALAALVAGACMGFLVYNWHPARIFLGDAGSLFVGFLLAAIALKLRFVVEPPASIAAVGLVVGLALFDTTLVVVSRLRAGRPLHVGGTDHLAHRLLILGLSCRRVAGLLALGTAASAGLGLAVGRHVLPVGPVVAGVTVVGTAALAALLRMPVYERGAGRVVRQSAARAATPLVPEDISVAGTG